jgi:hypothetical protein
MYFKMAKLKSKNWKKRKQSLVRMTPVPPHIFKQLKKKIFWVNKNEF